MSSVIQILNIFTLQANVRDLQHNITFSFVLFFLATTLDSFAFSKISDEYSSPALYAVALNSLHASFIYIALTVHAKQTRFIQLWSALLGASCIVNGLFLSMPVSSETMLFIFIPQIWMVYLCIRFYRETLECNWVHSMVVCLIIALLTLFSFNLIFPDYAKEDLAAKEHLINMLAEQ